MGSKGHYTLKIISVQGNIFSKVERRIFGSFGSGIELKLCRIDENQVTKIRWGQKVNAF